MRPAVVGLTIVLLLGCRRLSPSVEEVKIARALTVDTEWKSVEPPRPLAARFGRSELFVAIEGLSPGSGSTSRVGNDDTAIDVVLGTRDGSRLELTDAHVVGALGRNLLSVSSAKLHGGEGDLLQEFTRIDLKATHPIRVTGLAWVSYDPAKQKDGAYVPVDIP